MTRKCFTVEHYTGGTMVIPGCDSEREAIERYHLALGRYPPDEVAAIHDISLDAYLAEFTVTPTFNPDGTAHMGKPS